MSDRESLLQRGHKDGRGFLTFDNFLDDYGADVHVKQSSDIEGHVWVFVQGGSVQENKGSALLSPEGARRLARSLLEAADWIEERYGR